MLPLGRGTAFAARGDLLDRIRGEYREMPGMQLTTLQAGRLFGLDGGFCEAVLAQLRREGFLYRTQKGLFAMVKAGA